MHVIWMDVIWLFPVPAVARVRRSSPASRPSLAGDLRSALTPATVRRVDEAAGAGKMGGHAARRGSRHTQHDRSGWRAQDPLAARQGD
jgi:hypothetical protein